MKLGRDQRCPSWKIAFKSPRIIISSYINSSISAPRIRSSLLDHDDSLIFFNRRGCRVAKVSTVVDVGFQVGSVWVVNELTDVNPWRHEDTGQHSNRCTLTCLRHSYGCFTNIQNKKKTESCMAVQKLQFVNVITYGGGDPWKESSCKHNGWQRAVETSKYSTRYLQPRRRRHSV